jgi:hypothetical protein
MNINKMMADVDSNSNSTMPMEYSTGDIQLRKQQ